MTEAISQRKALAMGKPLPKAPAQKPSTGMKKGGAVKKGNC